MLLWDLCYDTKQCCIINQLGKTWPNGGEILTRSTIRTVTMKKIDEEFPGSELVCGVRPIEAILNQLGKINSILGSPFS
ncbi:MAG: hypothetical protein CL477_15865 [Acidobacteria bacterium]|nr:hypothetical protein [Acidobacteriota bacterium]